MDPAADPLQHVMAQPIVVAGESFATKSALKKRAQEILHGPLRTLEGQEFEFVLDLLRRHRRAAVKIGVGVRAIHVEAAPIWKKNHAFFVERVDGSKTDFSYLECISPSSDAKKFAAACRVLVVPQILQAKRQAFDANEIVRCPVSGDAITWDDCHVDHAEPWTFERLVKAFISKYSVDVGAVVDHDDPDMSFEQRLVDVRVAAKFVLFHLEHASLRVVSKRANLSTLRKRY